MIIFWYPRYLYFPSKAPPIHRSTGPPALALAGAVLPPTHTHTYTRTGGKAGVNQSIGQEKKAVERAESRDNDVWRDNSFGKKSIPLLPGLTSCRDVQTYIENITLPISVYENM